MNPEASNRQATNLAVAERYAAAWLAGDRAALAACYHDEFTLHYFGNNPFTGDHVGKAAALTALAKFSQRTGRKLLGIIDVMAGPERATVIARESFDRDGRKAELERVLVYTIKDGKLHECWVYDGDRALVDSFLAD
ncbi:MAG: nuclear transport factor 2 family protein [Pseudomonadota bacterium]